MRRHLASVVCALIAASPACAQLPAENSDENVARKLQTYLDSLASNSAFIVLGAIIEKLSGRNYYDYISENIFQPAGMSRSGVYEPGKQLPDVAIGYTRMDANGARGETETENIERRDHKLLDAEHTKLVTTGKVDAPGPIRKIRLRFRRQGCGR